jgi:hypothetical protein
MVYRPISSAVYWDRKAISQSSSVFTCHYRSTVFLHTHILPENEKKSLLAAAVKTQSRPIGMNNKNIVYSFSG